MIQISDGSWNNGSLTEQKFKLIFDKIFQQSFSLNWFDFTAAQ